MREFFCLVRKHDRHHLELKSNLPIPQKGKGKYDLNFYFFSPAQLHFTKKNISNDAIIRHIQTYTRFSSPALPLTGYTDPSCDLSPLTRIDRFFTRLDRGETISEPKIVYELQTMVNGFRGGSEGFFGSAAADHHRR